MSDTKMASKSVSLLPHFAVPSKVKSKPKLKPPAKDEVPIDLSAAIAAEETQAISMRAPRRKRLRLIAVMIRISLDEAKAVLAAVNADKSRSTSSFIRACVCKALDLPAPPVS